MATKKPFFSIIIPALNEARYLPKLLNDLSAQTFRDFEVIVVDGHSDDATVTKAKALASSLPRLTILSSPRRHVCTQRNLGAKHARADIFIFMDADNRLPPYFLQGIKYRWESIGVDILAPWIKPDIATPRNETIANTLNLFFELQLNIKPTYLLESMIIVSRTCFTTIGGFDSSVNYAEGKSFIRAATLHSFTASIVRDPNYTYSFRRLRKFGIIGFASRLAKLELAELLGQEYHRFQAGKLYPMLGGGYFAKPKRAKNKFLRNVAKLLKEF